MKIHPNSIKQKGPLNSQYGKIWYYNPTTLESKSFRKTDQIPSNWIKGRKCHKIKAIEKRKRLQYEYEKNPKLCEYCNNPISYDRRFYKTCCKKHGLLLRNQHNHETQLIRHTTGGKRSHSGRGKHGRYHGIWCDSSWELAWVIYQEEHQIKFKKYHGYFEYEFEGRLHKYYPDFELENGTIIEIKGYWSKQWQAKLDQLPKNKKLQILGKNEMDPILKYVKAKYGDDFIQLYE